MRERCSRVYRKNAKALAVFYDSHWDKPAPEGFAATYAKNLAAKRGYLPPMAWDDDSIDDPAAKPNQAAEEVIDWQAIERRLKGHKVKLSKAERKAACRAMAQRGATATHISRVMKVSGEAARKYIQEAAA